MTAPVLSSGMAGVPLAPLKPSSSTHPDGIQVVPAAYVSTRPAELVSAISSGCNLQVLYRYTRSTNLYSASMVTIELTLINSGGDDLTEVKITNKVKFEIFLRFQNTFQ